MKEIDRGQAKWEAGDYRGAIQDYSKSIGLNPEKWKLLLWNFMIGWTGLLLTFQLYFAMADTSHLPDYVEAFPYKSSRVLMALLLNTAIAFLVCGVISRIRKNWSWRWFFATYIIVLFIGAIYSHSNKINSPEGQVLGNTDYNNELDLKDAVAYYNRGSSKYDLEDYRGAIQDYTKAIELYPEYALAYYSRGLSKIILGDIDGGCLDLSKAGKLGYGVYDAIRKLCN